MFSTQQYFGFDPSTIPGCALWLDGADSNTLFSDSAGTTLVGASGNVGLWKDKSGGSNHYIQTTSGNRPSFANNTITCSTSAQTLLYASATITSITSYDVFAVGKPLPAAGNSWRTLLRGFPSEHPIIVESGGTRLGCFTNAAGFTQFGSLTLDGSARALIYLNISANRTHSAALNGTVPTSAATGLGVIGTDFYALGNYQFGGQPWGDINEIIIIENTTLAQRQQVEGYLAWKWGLQASLPIGHPFKSNPTTMRLFQPVDVADCCLWLDAADLSRFTPSNPTSGTTITQWRDKSSNGLVCVPVVGVSGNPIQYRTTTGLPSVYINNNNSPFRNVNTDAAISIPSQIQAGFSNFTYVGVFNVGNNGGIANYPRLQTWYVNDRELGRRIQLGPNFFEVNTAGGVFAGADEIVSTSVNNRIICTFVSDTSRFSWFINGIPCQMITTTTGPKYTTDAGATPRIGASGVDNRNSTGDFYETICYNRAISDQERTNIETYLGGKWNVFLDNVPAITTSQLLVPNDPSITANLQIWNDANSYSTNEQVLTTWVNRTGGTASSCTGTVLTNQLNSRPIVRFATTATYSTPSVSYSSYTMFFVGRYNGLGQNGRILQGPFGTNIFYGYWSSYKHVLYINNNPSILGGRARLADTLWDVMSHRRVNGGAYNLRFSQSTIYSGATSSAENFIQTLINTAGSPEETSNCDVAEIIIYNTALSDLQVQQIENYLNEKWNVYPTNKFPFYRAPPAVAVFTPATPTPIPNLYCRFYNLTSTPPSTTLGGSGWGSQIGTAGYYNPINFQDGDSRVGQSDNVGIACTGSVYSGTSGTIRFRVVTDDGSRVTFNGSVVIDAWISQPNTTYTSASVTLNPGYNLIEYLFFEGGGGMTCELYYELNGSGTFLSDGTGVFFETTNRPLTLWVDAADPAGNGVIPANGSTVSTWVDKSGLPNNMTSTGTVTYQGSPSRLVMSNSAMSATFSYGVNTLFIVYNQTGTSGPVFTTNNEGVSGLFPNENGTTFFARSDSAWATQSSTFPTNTINLLSVQYESAAPGSRMAAWLNGTLNISSTTSGTITRDRLTLALRSQNTQYMNGNYYEVIIYLSSLTTYQRQRVEGYLAWKWGLQNNLPTSHPYSKFRP